MGIVHNLSVLALRPLVGSARTSPACPASSAGSEALADWLADSFHQAGPHLATAMQEAGRRAWLAVELAVLGEATWERWEEVPALAGSSGLRDLLRDFLDQADLGSLPEDASFPQECGRELRAGRKKGLWHRNASEPAKLAHAASIWADPPDTTSPSDVERDLLERMAEDFRQRSATNLARLLEAQAQLPSALLVRAVRHFFRRARERDPALAQVLPEPAAEELSADQMKSLGALTDAIEQHGPLLETLLEERPRDRGDGPREGLDLRSELPRQPEPVQVLSRDILPILDAYQVDGRALQPADLLLIGAGEPREQVRQLLARCHDLTEDQFRQVPALLNALGKLRALIGDFDGAVLDFQRVVHFIPEMQIQAEAFASAYQVALEQRQYGDALNHLNRAAARDPERYAPFPLTKYEADKILRHDGFAVAFLCRHRNAGTNVVVRALRTDVLDHSITEVFQGMQVLDTLEYPAIARLRDCDYADADQTRPYVVHDFFGGLSLAEHLAAHGPLTPADLQVVARMVAEALHAAHGRNLLHGSVQPGHVLIRKDEGGTWRVKLMNFGLVLKRSVIRDLLDRPEARSRLALGASVSATLECAAPEQLGRLDGVPVGPPADIYAFGRTCYAALLRTTEPDDQEKDQLDPSWRKVLGQCTSWNVSRRPANFGAVLEKSAQPAAAPATVPVGGVKIDPAESAACVQRGVGCRQRGEIDQALAEFNRAVQLDPKNALAHQGRGNVLSTKGDYDKAIAEYTRALEIDPRLPLCYVNRGLAFVKKREIDRAIADYTKALEIDPKMQFAFLNRGSGYARQGHFDRAIADFSDALRLDPKLLQGYINRGLAYAKKSEFAKALGDYNRALELDPNNKEAKARRAEVEKAQQQGGQVRSARKARAMLEAPTPPNPGARPGQAARPPGAKSATNELLFVLEGHTDAVRSVAFSADGRRLATGSEDKSIRLWDARSGKKLGRFAGHTGGVTSVAFAPGGNTILSGSQDHSVRLWNVETGEELRRFGTGRFFGGAGHTEQVSAVAFSPDGKFAVSASWDKTVRLWEVDSGKELRLLEGHQWQINAVAFLPDGKHVVYGSEDQTVRLWNVETGEEVRRFSGHDSFVLSVTASPDGRLVLSGDSSGTMRLWSVARGKELRHFGGPAGLVQGVAFTPSGRHALSGEYLLVNQTALMRVWEVESGLEMARFGGHDGPISCVACSPDGRCAATASADKTVRMWRLPPLGK